MLAFTSLVTSCHVIGGWELVDAQFGQINWERGLTSCIWSVNWRNAF